MISYLKNGAKNYPSFDQQIKNNVPNYYDTLINLFFNVPLLEKTCKEREFDNIKMQYQVLIEIDKAVNSIPEDSLFFTRLKRFSRINKEPKITFENQNTYIAGYLVKHKHYPLVEVSFDTNGKLISIMPILTFEKKTDIEFTNFLERHNKKNKN